MTAFLALIGLGLVLAAFSGGGDDDEIAAEIPPEEEMPVDTGNEDDFPAMIPLTSLTEMDDSAIDQDYLPAAQADAADLVAVGEITQAEADAALDLLTLTSGDVNLDTRAGDDYVATGAGADTISAGAGDDFVVGGPGDDQIDLGQGDDVYGSDPRAIETRDDFIGFPDGSFNLFGEDSLTEGGDDSIVAGPGDDAVSDSFGANIVFGNQGNDFIVTVDEDGPGVSADTLDGGFGNDTLIVDEGDQVTGNQGRDLFTVDVFGGVRDGYMEVTITDFEPGIDRLELEGSYGLLLTPPPQGPDDVPVNPVTVSDLPDGSGAVVSIEGIPVVRVLGGAGLTVADLSFSV